MTAAGSLARRDAGTFAATLPHPLYFGAFRPASGDFRGASQSESAVHLDVALLGRGGRLQWSAFAGPSLLALQADLVQRVDYTQAYPFDTVTVTGTPFASTRNHAFGSTWARAWTGPSRATSRSGPGAFSRATVSLAPTADDRVEIGAGGLYLTGGLRLDF